VTKKGEHLSVRCPKCGRSVLVDVKSKYATCWMCHAEFDWREDFKSRKILRGGRK
jgi:hypothetical protein